MWYKFLQLLKTLSEKERRLLTTAVIVFGISSVILSVIIFYQRTSPQPVEGGNYTEGIVGQPIAINPLIAGENDADRDLIALLFSGLLDLAESYKSDESGKIWNIVLKENLKWSDGQPLTSADVVFTIGTIQNPDARSPFFATWQGVLAERLSEREIRLTLKNSYAFFLDNLKSLRVAPQHIFDNVPPQNYRLSEYNLKPVGSGPYKFVGFEKRADGFITKYSLAANANYAMKKPFIRSFSIRFYAAKADAIKALNEKEIDGLGNLDNTDLENITINHRIISAERPRYYAVFFNQSSHQALKEKDIRLSLNLATDREKILEKALMGRGTINYSPIPPSVSGYDPNLFSGESFSLDKATSTLEKAGWKAGEDGIRTKTIGRIPVKLEFDIIVPEAKFLIETVKILQEDWQKIGVSLNPIILKTADVINNAIKPRNYQMIVFGNTLNNNPDIFSFWHSSQRFDPGLDLALFGDKSVDTLLESVRQNLNETSRLQDLSKIQKLITDAKPAVFLYSPEYLYATSKNLGGFSATSIAAPANRFEKINEWYLKTARVFK